MTKHRSAAALRIAVVVLLLATSEGAAQSDRAPDAGFQRSQRRTDSRWMPAVSIQSGLLVHERDGFSQSQERGEQEGDTRALFGLLGGSAEIATPRIDFIPARPRLFAHADLFYSLDSDESITNESKPGDPITDLSIQLENNAAVSGAIGTGTSLRSQSEPLILSGGLGLSFETELAGRRLRIKPSLEWMFQRDEFRLDFAHVETVGFDPLRCTPRCRAVSTSNQETEGFHSLGPGLEVELDTGRMGDFTLSIFTQFRALRILGDRKFDIQATGSWFTRTLTNPPVREIVSIDPAPGRADSTATSTYRRDPWGFYAAAGIRILWNPE